MEGCSKCVQAEKEDRKRLRFHPAWYPAGAMLLLGLASVSAYLVYVHLTKETKRTPGDDLMMSIVTVSVVYACVYACIWLRSFIKHSVVGYYIYQFMGSDNEWHAHREFQAEYEDDSSGRYVKVVNGPMFRIRIGGWFKYDSILYQGCGFFWGIRRARGLEHPDSFILINRSSGEFHPMTLQTIRPIVMYFTGMHTMVSYLFQVERQRDHLGAYVMAAITEALDSRGKTKSPPAARVRTILETGINTLPSHQYGGPVESSRLKCVWQGLADKLASEPAERASV